MNQQLKSRLARFLFERCYKEGDFTLAPDVRTTFYFDCRIAALNCEGSWLLGSLFCEAVQNLVAAGVPVKGVGGMTLGADPLVTSTCIRAHEQGLPLNGLIVRKEAKGHGTGQRVEGLGNFRPGDSVVMLEDTVASGASLLSACRSIEEAGLKVASLWCIVDREEGGKENLKAQGYELHSLFTRSEVLRLAKGQA